MANPFPFASGDVLTAAELNSVGSLQTYTPNFRPTSGTWTTVFAGYARYGEVNDIVVGMGRIYIGNFGTGSNGVLFDLPVTADAGYFGIGNGRETALTGNQFHAYLVTPTVAALRFYNNGDTANNNYDFQFNFMYRRA